MVHEKRKGFPDSIAAHCLRMGLAMRSGSFFVIPRDETRVGYEEHSNHSEIRVVRVKNLLLHSLSDIFLQWFNWHLTSY